MLAPVALAAQSAAGAPVMPEPSGPVVKKSIESLIAEQLGNDPFEVGESITIDLDDVFDSYDQITAFVQNDSIANVTFLSADLTHGELLHIGATKAGSSMVDVIARRSDRPAHERFKLTVAPNRSLDAGSNGLAIDDLIRYINANPGKFKSKEDYRNLLDSLTYAAPTSNKPPKARSSEPVAVEVPLNGQSVVHLSDFFGDYDGDELTYKVSGLTSGTAVSGQIVGGDLILKGNRVTTGAALITVSASDGVAGHAPAHQQFSLNVTTQDTAPPVVSGVENGKLYNTDVTIGFTDGLPVTAKLNGATVASGIVVSAEGSHELVVTDMAGNATVARFAIDKTPPAGVITGVPAEPVSGSIALTLAVGADASGIKHVVLPNGSQAVPVDGKVVYEVTANGTYTFTIVDNAGNSGTITQAITQINEAPKAVHATTAVTLRNYQMVDIDLSSYFTDAHDTLTITDSDGRTSFDYASGAFQFSGGHLKANAYMMLSMGESSRTFTFKASDGKPGHPPAAATITISLDTAAPYKRSLTLGPADSISLADALNGYTSAPQFDGVAANATVSATFGEADPDWAVIDGSMLTIHAEDYNAAVSEDMTISYKYGNGTVILQHLEIIAHDPVEIKSAAAGKMWYSDIRNGDGYLSYDVEVRMADIFADADGVIDHYGFVTPLPFGVQAGGYMFDPSHFTDDTVTIRVNSDDSHSLTLHAYDSYGNVLKSYPLNLTGNHPPKIADDIWFSLKTGEELSVNLSDYVTDEDVETGADRLSYAFYLADDESGGTFTTNSIVTLSGEESGQVDYTFIARDLFGHLENAEDDGVNVPVFLVDHKLEVDPGGEGISLAPYLLASMSLSSPDVVIETVNVSAMISGSMLVVEAPETGEGGRAIVKIPTMTGGVTGNLMFELEVRQNSEPVLTDPDGIDAGLLVGAAMEMDLDAFFTDGEEDEIIYVLGDSPSFAATVSGSMLRMTAYEPGSGTVTVYAQDEFGVQTAQPLEIRLAADYGDTSIDTVAGAVQFDIVPTYFPSAINGEPLTFTAQSSDPDVVEAAVVAGKLVLTGKPVEIPEGEEGVSASVTLTADNGKGVKSSIDLSVTNLGDVPYFNEERKVEFSVKEAGESFESEPVEIDLNNFFTDPLTGGQLVYRITDVSGAIVIDSPSYETGSDLASSVLTVHAESRGSSYIEVTAVNDRNRTLRKQILIDHMNVAPQIDPLADNTYLSVLPVTSDLVTFEDLFYSYPLQYSDFDEDAKITVEALEGGERVELVHHSDGSFAHLKALSAGDVKLKITLDDGQASDSAVFAIHVLGPNEYTLTANGAEQTIATLSPSITVTGVPDGITVTVDGGQVKAASTVANGTYVISLADNGVPFTITVYCRPSILV